jgi:hypothetical protein
LTRSYFSIWKRQSSAQKELFPPRFFGYTFLGNAKKVFVFFRGLSVSSRSEGRMKTKYQVFVSSTYEDLKEERDQVLKAILEMGHIPVGMELFSAGDEQQWELIKRQIDDSDYYIVVLAHRYGSRDGAISYTEKEYDYAVSKKVPILGFVISDDAKWPKSKIDEGTTQRALVEFKNKVKKKIVNFWTGSEDLHGKVSISLGKAITAYPRPGWVRATTNVGPEVTNELSRLSKENSELRIALSAASSKVEEGREQEEQRILALLAANRVPMSIMLKGNTTFTTVGTVTLDRIFRLLAPELFVEKSAKDSSRFLGILLNPGLKAKLNMPWPIGSNQLRGWLADFAALGLIAPSAKKHHIKDPEDYWCITEKGRKIYTSIRVAALEVAAEDRIPGDSDKVAENKELVSRKGKSAGGNKMT